MNYHKDFYINRLVKEWLTHDKIIIACDRDDTLFPYNECRLESCLEVRELLLQCQEEGIYLILNTAQDRSNHENVKKEVEDLGLNVASVNETPAFLNLPYGNHGKVYANIFLDDRSGLSLSLYQLRVAYETVKEIRTQQKFKDQ